MKKIRETTAFFNKEYKDAPDGPFMRALQIAFLKKMVERGGNLPDHAYYADDCFVLYRNLGFLSDPVFCKACEDSHLDKVLLGRIWRIYVVAWALAHKWNAAGTFIDCGTYNGKAFEAALRYALAFNEKDTLGGKIDRRVIAADLFEDPPVEARKPEHGPSLHSEVGARLNTLFKVEVCKGYLPESLAEVREIEDIVWAQIDLNSAESDLSTFKHLLPSLKLGAFVIFDDYGFSRYKETQRQLDAFVHEKGLTPILEMPTGQGLYMHHV